jgi:hypothetical protein
MTVLSPLGRRLRLALILFAAAPLSACSNETGAHHPEAIGDQAAVEYLLEEAVGPPASCEGVACLLPWPSTRLLVEDAGTATGYRIDLDPSWMPVSLLDVPVDTGPWNAMDGFSPMTSVVVQLPAPVAPEPLVDWERVPDSLAPTSPTLLLDATSGELVAHFAELQEGPDVDPEHRTLYLRPAQRLEEDHHYVVGVRNLTLEDGTLLVPGDAAARWRHLLDHASSDTHALARDALQALVDAGVALDDLILAWDFHTASGPALWGDLVAMRDRAEAAATAGELDCAVSDVTEDLEDPEYFRVIDGTFQAPLFQEADAIGSPLARDEAGAPTRNGFIDVPFRAIVPHSVREAVAEGGDPARLVTYGHGLFNDQHGELDRAWMRATVDAHPMVLVGTDMRGLSSADLAFVVGALNEVGRFPLVIDRLAQSLIQHHLLARSVATGCADDPAFQLDGRPLFDGDDRHYYGNSQGSIFGMTLAALSTDIDRFALGVGGISYPIMLPRAFQWPALEEVLATFYPSRIERDLLIVMFATHWDRVEGATFAPHVLRDPLPGSMPRRVLFQVARNDAQTPNVASQVAARTLGIPQLMPSVQPVDGLTPFAEGDESAYVAFDYGAADLPAGPVPPTVDEDTHRAVRADPRAQVQIDAFLRADGRIVDTCEGACSPPSSR